MANSARIKETLDIFGEKAIHYQCSVCKQWFPLHANFFHRNKSKKFGFATQCIDCLAEKRRNLGVEENTKIWFAKRAKAAKGRAKKKGIDFNLKFDDLEYPEFCPMTKKKLTYAVQTKDTEYHRNRADQRPEAASLDRIDPSEGYVAGNVRVVSWLYNHIKGPHTDAFTYETCKIFVDNNPHLDIM